MIPVNIDINILTAYFQDASDAEILELVRKLRQTTSVVAATVLNLECHKLKHKKTDSTTDLVDRYLNTDIAALPWYLYSRIEKKSFTREMSLFNDMCIERFGKDGKNRKNVFEVTGGLVLEVPQMEQNKWYMSWNLFDQKNGPKTILIVKKRENAFCKNILIIWIKWLAKYDEIRVVVEEECFKEFTESFNNVKILPPDADLEHCIDLVITLGGDGTLLHAIQLFKNRGIPPVLSFAAGSLGFLTVFKPNEFCQVMRRILNGEKYSFRVALKMRLKISIVKQNQSREFHVLNEIIIHRGVTNHLCLLEVLIDGDYVTQIRGDGLIVATATGSTAYSSSAGGAMVHPGVPSILLTTVAPSLLSARPIILPDYVRITVRLAEETRGDAVIGLDGQNVDVLQPGEEVDIIASNCFLPHIWPSNEKRTLWWRSLKDLRWNESHIPKKVPQ